MKKDDGILGQILSLYVLFNSQYSKHEGFVRKLMNQQTQRRAAYCTLHNWNKVIYFSLKSPLKIHTHTQKKSPLTFLHLNYLSPSVNGNIFYPTGTVKLNLLVPATTLKSLEMECHRCQVLYYHSSIKQT